MARDEFHEFRPRTSGKPEIYHRDYNLDYNEVITSGVVAPGEVGIL